MKELGLFFRCLHVSIFRRISSKSTTVNLKYNFKFSSTKGGMEDEICEENTDTKISRTEGAYIVSDDLLKYSKSRKGKIRKQAPVMRCKGEMLYGIYPVYLSLLQNKRKLYEIFIKHTIPNTAEKHNMRNTIQKIGQSLGVKITEVNSWELKHIAPDIVHQGVCMDVSSYPLLEYEKKENVENTESHADLPVWLVLDEIQDPMNVGAILRSAYYFGIDKIFITVDYSCKLTPTVSKASSGVLEILDIYKIYDLVTFLKEQKELGWNVISTTAYNSYVGKSVENTVNLHEFSVTKPTILILGNESRGSSLPVMTLCNHFITIYPRRNLHVGIDSLNVSSAAAILLHHLSKKS